MTQQRLTDGVNARIEQLQQLLANSGPGVKALMRGGIDTDASMILAQVAVWLTVQELSESSKRLEKVTARLVWFTWALIIITAFLFAIELLRYLGYQPTGL